MDSRAPSLASLEMSYPLFGMSAHAANFIQLRSNRTNKTPSLTDKGGASTIALSMSETTSGNSAIFVCSDFKIVELQGSISCGRRPRDLGSHGSQRDLSAARFPQRPSAKTFKIAHLTQPEL
jgi:hypothetical protein